jgi:hypothetical protein
MSEQASPHDVEACIKAMPKAIKLGAYDWKVVLEHGDEDMYGEAVFATDTLRLWPKNLTSASHAVGIVIHECLHVIFDHAGLEKLKRGREEREEQIVMGFQDGLVSLLRDNPKLMTWMKKWL